MTITNLLNFRSDTCSLGGEIAENLDLVFRGTSVGIDKIITYITNN